jgi:multiple antibiotic resistance protein
MENFESYLLAFTALFVAFDALGVLPIYISLTQGVSDERKKELVNKSCLTALIVGLIFLFSGESLFKLLGITSDDFRIGGGILLFLIALSDILVSGEKKRRAPTTELAIVPIGIPLILGPGVMTTLLLLISKHGYLVTLVCFFINMVFVWLVFLNSRLIIRFLGQGGALAFGKVASLFLLAIAVMMIRVGIQNVINS